MCDLAEQVYVSSPTVSRWENGKRLPDAAMISRLAEVLGADVSMLLTAAAQSASGNEIAVENDGPDFAPANDNEPHIGLENIRRRIRLMCGGTLTITPRDGGGTFVTVCIPPKNRNSKMNNRSGR